MRNDMPLRIKIREKLDMAMMALLVQYAATSKNVRSWISLGREDVGAINIIAGYMDQAMEDIASVGDALYDESKSFWELMKMCETAFLSIKEFERAFNAWKPNDEKEKEKMAKTKIETNKDIPQSRSELNEKIAELGRNERMREKITIEMNEQIAKVKARYADDAKDYDLKIESLQKGISAYCEVHRDELTDNGKTKTVKLPAGTLSWRVCPPSCRLSKPEAIMESLKSKGLSRFIRIKEEISKDLILADPEAVASVKGITIIKGKEELSIEPDKEELEKAA